MNKISLLMPGGRATRFSPRKMRRANTKQDEKKKKLGKKNRGKEHERLQHRRTDLLQENDRK